MLTKKTAYSIFKEEIREGGDRDLIRISWELYTDALQRDGYITMKQYETWTNPF